MLILNLFIKHDDKTIHIIFETLSFCEKEKAAHSNERPMHHVAHALYNLLDVKQFDCIKKELKPTQTYKGDDFIEITYQNTPYLAKVTGVQYRLPHHRRTALDFFAAIDTWLEIMEFDHVLISDSSVNQWKSEGQLMQTLENYLQCSCHAKAATEQLVTSLLALHCPIPLYTSTLKAIASIHDFAEQNGKLFTHCLDVRTRYLILYTNTDTPFTANHTSYGQIHPLIDLAQLIFKFNPAELIHFADNLALDVKKALFKPAIGQPAFDEGRYDWSYKEWQLIRAATMIIQEDGCLAIDMPTNEAYQDYYAKGQVNHAILEKEMRHLQRYIPTLQFKDNINFHKKIILSPTCSALLLQQGIQFNKNSIQNMLQMKNALTFFGKTKENPAAAISEDRLLYENLLNKPLEITALIMSYKFLDLTKGLSRNDLIGLLQYTFMHANYRKQRAEKAAAIPESICPPSK